MHTEEKPFRVSASSNPNAVAGAVARAIRKGAPVSLLAIGASSVNQTVKALCIVRSFLEADNLDIAWLSEFVELELSEGERTAILFTVIHLAQRLAAPASTRKKIKP